MKCATGSSTQGTPAPRAASAAFSMPLCQWGEIVPTLIVTAPAMGANSAVSSAACTMAGEAPEASTTFAATFIAT